jgi:hypothetical protein
VGLLQRGEHRVAAAAAEEEGRKGEDLNILLRHYMYTSKYDIRKKTFYSYFNYRCAAISASMAANQSLSLALFTPKSLAP